jgi:hypothetical protein
MRGTVLGGATDVTVEGRGRVVGGAGEAEALCAVEADVVPDWESLVNHQMRAAISARHIR